MTKRTGAALTLRSAARIFGVSGANSHSAASTAALAFALGSDVE
jgi:hypothetical protein